MCCNYNGKYRVTISVDFILTEANGNAQINDCELGYCNIGSRFNISLGSTGKKIGFY